MAATPTAPMMASRRAARITLAVLALAPLLTTGCKPKAEETAAASAKATRRDIVGVALLNGDAIVPPNSRADILPPYSTTVAKVYSAVGQSVKKGEVLLELSAPSAQAAYDQNRQAVKASQGALKNADQQYSQAIDSALKRLEAARAKEQAARKSAQDQVAAAGNAGDDAAAAATAAGSALELQQATEERLAAEQELVRARQAKDAGTAPYEQQLTEAKTAFGGAQGARKAAAIRAPISGEVLAFDAQVNGTIGADAKKPFITIVDLSDVTVHAPIPAGYASYVKEDMKVSMTFPQAPNTTFEGEVEDIDTRPSGAGQTSVAVIEFKNDKGLVKPGMKGTISAKVGEVKNVLAVPNEAVDTDDNGKTIVYIQRNDMWEPTVVEVGLSDGTYTEIKTGLQEGDTVQLTPDKK